MKYTMSDEQFNDALKAHADAARNMLTGKQRKEFGAPLLITHELTVNEETGEPDGPEEAKAVVHVLEDFGGEEGRMLLDALGRMKAREEVMPIACFVVAEAWVAVWASDEPFPYEQPRDDPERREIVTVAGMTIQGHVNYGSIALSRDAEGYLVAGESEVYGYGEAGPKMGNNLGAAFYRGYTSVINDMVKSMAARMN
jgi:hypothetical protein